MSTKVIIAEDNELFRETLERMISASDGPYELVGKAKDGLEALRLVEQRDPDLLILDLHMPKLDGFSVIEQVRDRNTDMKILVLTISQSQRHLDQALQRGADGYCTKTSGRDAVFEAMDTVIEGSGYVSADAGESL